MFTQSEVFYVKPATFGFSNIIRDRILKEGVDGGGQSLLPIENPEDRNKLIQFLKNQSNEDLRKIRLSRAETNGCHDVSHGGQPIGDFYFSDMIAGLHDIKSTDSILDFGCSTGRVIRNLRAAYDFNAYGCDPRAESIDFNKENFSNVNWFVSNEAPPLQAHANYTYDLIFAISVWSHFSPQMALAWFEEFHGQMNKGGKIIITTHGSRSVFHFHKKLQKMDEIKAKERLEKLRENGFHYMPYPSGSDLDNSHWGMAFISRAWLTENLSDKWRIKDYLPGMAMENQDVYVIEAI